MADKIVKDLSESFLNCCICMNHFKTPKMLPCIHSFCQECLLKYANTQKGNDIACPTCRKVCTLPEAGVKGLQTNFHLVNLAEKVVLLEKLTSPKERTNVCDSCKHQEVVAFCFECNFAICSKCKDHHLLFPVLRSHSVVPTEAISDPKFQTGWRNPTSPFCDMHSSEKLNFYCKTCSKLICRECTIVMHSKPDHEYVDVVTQVSTITEALTTMLDKSNDNLSKGLSFIMRGKEGSEAIKEMSRKLKNEITEQCLKKLSEVEKMLNDQKSSLVKIVSGVESKKVEIIEAKLQIAEDWVGRMKDAQDLTQHVIQEGNPWELLGMSADLMNAFETLQVESEDLDWQDTQLQQDVIFNPEHISDVRLGACDYSSEAVATDPNGNFILCHFDLSNKMLHLRALIKESKYSKVERFPPYQWQHEVPTGTKVNITAGRQNYLYIALGKVVAIFNCQSKECLNEKKIYDQNEPNEFLSSIAYSPRAEEMCNCVNLNKFDSWDVGFSNRQNRYGLQFNAIFMFPSNYDVLFGCEEGNLLKYSLQNQTWSTFDLPPPPEFNEGQILFYEGLRKDPVVVSQRYVRSTHHHRSRGRSHGRYVYEMTDEFVCFIAWLDFKFDAKSNHKTKRWILKEYCTQKKVFVGVLDNLKGKEEALPAALHCKELDNGGMEIHLCDSQGRVISYKRGAYQENPVPYQRYDPEAEA